MSTMYTQAQRREMSLELVLCSKFPPW